MSVFQLRSLPCSRCGAPRAARIADSANPLRHPPFRDELLGRTLHRFPCDRCGRVDVADGPMVWTDVTARLVAWVVPEANRPQWPALEADAIAGLTPVVRSEGPPFVRAWGATAKIRLVFGFEELREKVVARQHDLDDEVIEVLKFPFLDHDNATGPVLESVEPDGLRFALAVEPSGSDGSGPEGRTVAMIPWAEYEAAVERRGEHASLHPGLFQGAWVHWARAGFPPRPARRDAAPPAPAG